MEGTKENIYYLHHSIERKLSENAFEVFTSSKICITMFTSSMLEKKHAKKTIKVE